MPTAKIHIGDCRDVLRTLPDSSVHTCITSPPYFGLRDYGVDGQIGLEQTPDEYVQEIVQVFREVRRVLRSDGTLWLNLGDSYAGSWGAQSRGNTTGERSSTLQGGSMLSARQITSAPHFENGTGSLKNTPGLKSKDLIGIPWRVAFALQADGWYLRQDIIWHKPNPMPESVTDRCTKAHEYVFLLSKSERYHYDQDAIREPHVTEGNRRDPSRESYGTNGRLKPLSAGERDFNHPLGRNKRTVWTVATQPFSEAHFATFPPTLIEPCILAGCPEGGTVLDPFSGAGTTGLVALAKGRNYIGIELNEAYADMSRRRIESNAPMFNRVEIVWHKAAEAV